MLDSVLLTFPRYRDNFFSSRFVDKTRETRIHLASRTCLACNTSTEGGVIMSGTTHAEFPLSTESPRFRKLYVESFQKVISAEDSLWSLVVGGGIIIAFWVALVYVAFHSVMTAEKVSIFEIRFLPFFFLVGVTVVAFIWIVRTFWKKRDLQRKAAVDVADPLFQQRWTLLQRIQQYDNVLLAYSRAYRDFPVENEHLIAACQSLAAWREDLFAQFEKEFPEKFHNV